MNLPCDGNCLIKSEHVQFTNMHFHNTAAIRGSWVIPYSLSYLMQQISIFLDLGGLPICQHGKGQISFIKIIKCSNFDQNVCVCVCVGISHALTHTSTDTK